MDLKSGYPYWVVKNEQGEFHPPLADDFRCDVLVVGAGITGALIADCLSAAGHQVCLVDSRQIGWGSTSASTALLQYEIDVEMQDLAKRFGGNGITYSTIGAQIIKDSLERRRHPCAQLFSFARLKRK